MSRGQQFDEPDNVSTEKVDAVRGPGRSIVRGFAWLRSRPGAVVLVATLVAFVVVSLVLSSNTARQECLTRSDWHRFADRTHATQKLAPFRTSCAFS